MKLKVFWIVAVLVVIGANSACGVEEATAPPTEIPATATPIPPEPGHFQGTNPDVSFDLLRTELSDTTLLYNYRLVIYNFRLVLQLASGPCIYDKSFAESIGGFNYEPGVNVDGYFGWGNAALGGLQATPVIMEGVISGKNARVEYTVSRCTVTQSIQPSLKGEWSASWTGPSSYVPPATPIPPKKGHFQGTNPTVSFDVDGGGVINFHLDTGTCTFSSQGRWILSGGGFASMSVGIPVMNTIKGTINGGQASGSYGANGCDGNWSAKWVSP